jgi:hypothetical protein
MYDMYQYPKLRHIHKAGYIIQPLHGQQGTDCAYKESSMSKLVFYSNIILCAVPSIEKLYMPMHAIHSVLTSDDTRT